MRRLIVHASRVAAAAMGAALVFGPGCTPGRPTATVGPAIESKTVPVVAEGTGRNEPEAIESAIRTAIETAVGSVLLAKGVVEDDRLVSDRVVSTTAGYQERYEKLRVEPRPGGLIWVELRVWVRTEPLGRATDVEGTAAELGTGPDLAHRTRTLLRRQLGAAATMGALFEGWPERVLEASVVTSEGRDFRLVEPGVIEVVVEVRVDPDRWARWMHSAAGVLEACSESVDRSPWTLHDAGNFSLDAVPDGVIVGGVGMSSAMGDPRAGGPLTGLRNVIPPSVRGDSIVFGPTGSARVANIPDEEARSVLLFGKDSPWSPGIRYRVRPEARAIIEKAIVRVPTLRVSPVGDGGSVQAAPRVDWPTADWFGGSTGPSAAEIGRPELRASASPGRERGRYSAGIGFPWARLVPGRSGPIVLAPMFVARNLFLIESRSGQPWPSSAILAPRVRFPFRFRLSTDDLARVSGVELRWDGDAAP